MILRILGTLALACAGAGVAVPAYAADTTPPTITISVPESPGTGTWAGWYAAPVEVRVSATDDTVVSALRYQMTGAQNESGFPPPPEFTRTVTQQGTTTLTVGASDPLGNHAERTYGIGLDLTDPTVTFGGDVTNGSSIRRGQVRRLTYTCADQPTAIVSCAARIGDAPFASGDPVPTDTNGAGSVVVTATDAVGRKVDKAFRYFVIDPSLEVTEPPGIVGDPTRVVVGQTLTARPPEFNPPATAVTYHWFSHTGDELHVGPTFVVPPDQFTYHIHVRARGTRDGYLPTETGSQGARVFGESRVSGHPTINSIPAEGTTLRVSAANVDPAPETTRTVWTVGSRRVEAADLTLTPADVGQQVGCEQVYLREDYLDAHAPCVFPGGATTATVAGHAWTVQTGAGLKGKAKVGKKLRAVLPVLSGPATSYAYQWLRNGKPIKGATRASYKLRRADARRKVTVRVTASTAHRADTVSVATPKRVRR